MKKWLLVWMTVMILLLTACQKQPTYTPDFEIGEGYALTGDVISGTVVGEEYISLFSIFTTQEKFIIFGDSTAETFLEGGIVPLKAGKNRLVVRFYTEEAEREYELQIEYIPIRSLSIEVLDPLKTYHIGEKLDKTTIRVWATSEDGESIVVENYEAEYAFSELGEADVGIELGAFYESFTVQVTEEYQPTLDGDFSADGVNYALQDGNAVLLSAKNMDGFFSVPQKVIYDGVAYPVIELANGAFAGTDIKRISIPEGVKTLSMGVFSGCKLLEEAELPDSLTSIGRQAFSDCTALDYMILPEGLQTIEYGTFLGCSSLFRVVLPKSLSVIGERAFSDCESLKLLDFPTSVEIIEKEAFSGCKALESVILDHLLMIGENAFKNCENLTVFAVGDVQALGKNILSGTEATVYTAENSTVFSYAERENLSVEIVGETPFLISQPKTFAIEDGYPYQELMALICLNGRVSELKNHEVIYEKDQCGKLTATLIWGDFEYCHEIFVSYTETVMTDTDTRGAKYELDAMTKTAILVELPLYVKPSKIYHPEQEGLFLVPTMLSCPDGLYTVTEVRDGVMDACENVTELFIPVL